MINKNQTKRFVYDPWPYVIVENFFEPEIADRIVHENALQKWAEKEGNKEYLKSIENKHIGSYAHTYRAERVNYFPECGIDIEDNGFIDSIIKHLMGYDGRQYLQEIVDDFKDYHRPLRIPHDTDMGGFHWVYCMNDATDTLEEPTHWGMGIHCDIPWKLLSGMIYVRHEDDIETGTEIYNIDEYHHTVPNTHNTAFFWPNIVGETFHKPQPRGQSPFQRQFFNLSLWRGHEGLDYANILI